MTDLHKKHLDWLITMSKHPGFRNHAWFRAKELDKCELFAGISGDLEREMKMLKENV